MEETAGSELPSTAASYDYYDTQLLENIYQYLQQWRSADTAAADTIIGQSIPLLQSFVYDLDYGQHYAAWPESDGYHIVVAGDIQFVSLGSQISVLASGVVRYSILDFNYDSASPPSLVVSNTSSVTGTTTSSALIFSDIGNYPRLIERSVPTHVEATFVILLSCCVFYFAKRMRDSFGS